MKNKDSRINTKIMKQDIVENVKIQEIKLEDLYK